MPLPVRYIDSSEYLDDRASSSLHRDIDSRKETEFSILKQASSSLKLQALSVHNIVEVIRLLGSLAKHAESIMGDIADALVSCQHRTEHLHERTQRLSEAVLTSLDADREACEGFVIPHPDLHFKSDRHIDQKLLSKKHTPQALLEQINLASSPALYKFNSLWEDGRNAMHFFSNPDFFFENWRNSVRKEAMRRKSTVDNLQMTSSDHGLFTSSELKKGTRTSKESGVQVGQRSRANTLRAVHGSKSIKRNTKLSKSFHGHHDLVRHQYGSHLSSKKTRSSGSFRRTSSFRASARYSLHKKDLHSPFAKAISANFDGPPIELSVPNQLIAEGEDDVLPLQGTLSTAGVHSHSQSWSTYPKLNCNDSVFTGMHMYTVDEELSQQDTFKLSTLSKHHLQTLDLATSDFQTCLSIDSCKRLNSTFAPPVSIFGRSITPIHLMSKTISEQPSNQLVHSNHPRREPPPIPNTAANKSSTKTKKHNLPKVQRSATISAGNPTMKKTAAILKAKYRPDKDRPASVALVGLFTMFDHSTESSLVSTSSADQQDKHTSFHSHGQSLITQSTQENVPTLPAIQNQITFVKENTTKPVDVNNITESTTVHSTLKFIPVPGPPPPPRSDSLSVKSSAQNSLFSSSMVHKPQQHGTLDASQEESVASAVSKSLPGSPCTPADQAYSSNVEEGSSPIQPDITDTNHNHSEEVISPHEEDSVSTEDTVMSIAGDTGMIQRQRPVQLIKQDSLYISPRKLSIASHPYPEDVSKRKTHGEILRAGGIVHSVDLSGSRSNLLEAIRKGIQLRKVEEEDRSKKEDSTPWDVAAILERYQVLHSDNDSNSEGEIQDWDDI